MLNKADQFGDNGLILYLRITEYLTAYYNHCIFL